MKKLALSLLFAGFTVSLMADPSAMYKKCAGCHGADGSKKALGKSKVISAMSVDEIAKSLRGYKDGTYGGKMKGLMKGQVRSLKDGDIDAFSAYIAGLK